ncbi:hypothetical protein AaE_013290 [Aphanomyces astaci]|nr:hypothetical protein AaE_013290 [Aphanomyces astaci]
MSKESCIEERRYEIERQRAVKANLQRDIENLQRKRRCIALQKSRQVADYYTMHGQVLQMEEARANALEKRHELDLKLQATTKEKSKWKQRVAHVVEIQRQEALRWSAFTESIQKSIEGQAKPLDLETSLREERDMVNNVLQQQYDNGAKALQEAKHEIHETKMILKDMEKKKNILATQLRQAQGNHDQLLAREQSARATTEMQQIMRMEHPSTTPVSKPPRRRHAINNTITDN